MYKLDPSMGKMHCSWIFTRDTMLILWIDPVTRIKFSINDSDDLGLITVSSGDIIKSLNDQYTWSCLILKNKTKLVRLSKSKNKDTLHHSFNCNLNHITVKACVCSTSQLGQDWEIHMVRVCLYSWVWEGTLLSTGQPFSLGLVTVPSSRPP